MAAVPWQCIIRSVLKGFDDDDDDYVIRSEL